MSVVVTLPYGAPVFEALVLVISEAKRDDALAPVTVVVPSNYAALSMRRELGRRGPVVNVRFLVLARLAELLGAPSMPKERRPLTPWRRAEAIRAALLVHRGTFERVASHPATERALESTFRDLSLALTETLEQLPRLSKRGADAVAIYRDYRALVADTYEVEDLAHAAAAAVRAGSAALGDIGHVAFFLPRALSAGQAELARALSDRGASFITGIAHDRAVYETHVDLLASLGVRGDPGLYEGEAATATNVLRAVDQEEEVRAVVRSVLALAESGTPLHRMAVLFGSSDDYAPLVAEQFAAAGIPINGPPIAKMVDTMAGRFLARLLRLERTKYRRDAVMEWLTAAPAIESVEGERAGHLAPAAAWDEIARDAGIVHGFEQWSERLTTWARMPRTSEAAAALALRLRDFMEDLARQLRPPREPSLAAMAEWADSLFERYLASVDAAAGQWPAAEAEAYAEIRSMLRSIVDEPPLLDPRSGREILVLGELSLTEAVDQFADLLNRHFDRAIGRLGPHGSGVFVGGLSVVRGMRFEHTFVLGMVDGILPPSGREDPIIPDEERNDSGLPQQGAVRARWREDYLAAIASAGETTLCFAQSSLRSQSKQMPSRWLLESVSRLAGERKTSEQFAGLHNQPWLHDVFSFEHAISGERPPASAQEWELRSLFRGGNPREHFLAEDPVLESSMAAAQVRMPAWTRRHRLDFTDLPVYSGGVGPGYQFDANRAYSATSLETLAVCGFKYFLGNVARVKETNQPEIISRIPPMDRGNVIHDVLEAFFRDRMALGLLPGPGEPWNEADREALMALANVECDRAEARGITGSQILWKVDRSRILRDLVLFLEADTAERAKHNSTFLHAEQAFGSSGEEAWSPVEIPVGDGQTVRFNGRIDRVDRAADGTLLVYDYKTGSAYSYKKLDSGESEMGSPAFLQLPIYGRAVQEKHGLDGESVAAYYWFASEREDFRVVGGSLDSVVDSRLEDTLGVLVRMAESGTFPPVPGGSSMFYPGSRQTNKNCKYCPYDRVCEGGDRERAWTERKSSAGIAEYISLVERTQDEESSSD